jgi:hypothetical protein
MSLLPPPHYPRWLALAPPRRADPPSGATPLRRPSVAVLPFPFKFSCPELCEAFPQTIPPLLKLNQHLSSPDFNPWLGSVRRHRSPPVSPAVGVGLALDVQCSQWFVGLWCFRTHGLGWGAVAWAGTRLAPPCAAVPWRHRGDLGSSRCGA